MNIVTKIESGPGGFSNGYNTSPNFEFFINYKSSLQSKNVIWQNNEF